MTPADRAIVAAAEERDRAATPPGGHEPGTCDYCDRYRELTAQDAADDAAAETATKGRWR